MRDFFLYCRCSEESSTDLSLSSALATTEDGQTLNDHFTHFTSARIALSRRTCVLYLLDVIKVSSIMEYIII
jgi:hypothetical protein